MFFNGKSFVECISHCLGDSRRFSRLFSVHSDRRIHSKLLDVLNQLFQLVSTPTTSNDAFLLASLQLLTVVLLNSYPSLAGVLHIDSFEQLPKMDRTDASQSIDLISSTIELLDQLLRLASTDESKKTLLSVSDLTY